MCTWASTTVTKMTEAQQFTKPQAIAIHTPCLLAVETALPRFTHRTPLQVLRLTCNTGYE